MMSKKALKILKDTKIPEGYEHTPDGKSACEKGYRDATIDYYSNPPYPLN